VASRGESRCYSQSDRRSLLAQQPLSSSSGCLWGPGVSVVHDGQGPAPAGQLAGDRDACDDRRFLRSVKCSHRDAAAGCRPGRHVIRVKLDAFYLRAAASSSPRVHRLAATIEAWMVDSLKRVAGEVVDGGLPRSIYDERTGSPPD